MKTVFVVQHEDQRPGSNDTRIIRADANREAAEAAAERLREQPGFCDWPDGFSIDKYELDKDHWSEGLSSV